MPHGKELGILGWDRSSTDRSAPASNLEFGFVMDASDQTGPKNACCSCQPVQQEDTKGSCLALLGF